MKCGLTESNYVEVIVHICEKFNWILIDNRYGNYDVGRDYTYNIVRAADRVQMKCCGIDILSFGHYYLVPPLSSNRLSSHSSMELLLKLCTSRSFAPINAKSNDIHYGNPYFGSWDKIKNASSAEEAIVLLDLYIQH